MPLFNQGDVISSFLSPSDAAQGLDGDSSSSLWIVDAGNNDRLQKTTQDGSVISSFSTPESGPTDVATESSFLWIADQGPDRISKVNTSGSVVSSFDITGAAWGVAIDSNGSIAHTACVAADDERVVIRTQAGSVISSFSITWAGRGLVFDSADSIWHAGGTVRRTNRTGTVGTSFSAPSTSTVGIGTTPSGFLWSNNFNFGTQTKVAKLSEKARGIAPATNPTLSATQPSIAVSATTSATATKPTLSASVPVAHSDTAFVAQGSKPTLSATATTAPGNAGVDATATKPTLSATAREPLVYGDVPLLDGEPITEDVAQTVRHDEIELRLRVDQATLDAIVRSVETNTGKYEQLDEPTGGFTTRDTTGGSNTFRYNPRYAEQPFLLAQDVLADAYVERPAAQDASAYRVTLTLKPAANREPTTGLISESKGNTDWLFETYAGAIATPNVERNVEAESQAGTLGFVLDVFLDADQANALRVATGRQGAVGTAGGERDDVLAVDNAPNAENTVVLTPRNTAQMAEQRYVIRDVEFTRLDPDGTHYVATVELLPAAVGARGKAGHGKAGEYKAGEA